MCFFWLLILNDCFIENLLYFCAVVFPCANTEHRLLTSVPNKKEKLHLSPVGFCCESDPVDNHVISKTKNHSGIHRYVEKYVLHLVLMCSVVYFLLNYSL